MATGMQGGARRGGHGEGNGGATSRRQSFQRKSRSEERQCPGERLFVLLLREVPMLRSVIALALLPFPSAFAQTSWPLDGVQEYLVPVAPQESLRVTIAGAGETVVLVPGLFGSAFGYRHLLAMLPAAGFRTIVIEPLGIGRSPRPKRADYSLTGQADRLDAVLRSLDEPPAIVVGHSLGASMALRLAYRHPGRVRALIALDG